MFIRKNIIFVQNVTLSQNIVKNSGIIIVQKSKNRKSFKKELRLVGGERGRGIALDFCSPSRIISFETLRKNLRSPFQNNTPCCFSHCVRIPIIFSPKSKKAPSFEDASRFWRRERDSNPRVHAHKLISSQPRYDHFDISP